jgi:hypothetical protein
MFLCCQCVVYLNPKPHLHTCTNACGAAIPTETHTPLALCCRACPVWAALPWASLLASGCSDHTEAAQLPAAPLGNALADRAIGHHALLLGPDHVPSGACSHWRWSLSRSPCWEQPGRVLARHHGHCQQGIGSRRFAWAEQDSDSCPPS